MVRCLDEKNLLKILICKELNIVQGPFEDL